MKIDFLFVYYNDKKLVYFFTSRAALSPACTAPLMYPVHLVAVSVPARKILFPIGSLIAGPYWLKTPGAQ